MKMLSNLDLNKNEIQNVRVQNLATAPSNPVVGQIYFNTTDKTAYVYDGTSWRDMAQIVDLSTKQDTLVSGTNIKTINGSSVLGSGDLVIDTGGHYTAGDGISITDDGVVSNTYGYQDSKLRLWTYCIQRATVNTLEGLETALVSKFQEMLDAIAIGGLKRDTNLFVLSDPIDANGDVTFNDYVGEYIVNYVESNETFTIITLAQISAFANFFSYPSTEQSNDLLKLYGHVVITITASYNESGSKLIVNNVSLNKSDEKTLNVLATDKDYTTPYMPLYNGSPTTKIYVDGKVQYLGEYVDTNFLGITQKGSAGGVASLDSTGKVPSSQLPSYVDDVIEGYYYNGNFYTDSAHTQLITPETGKIYVDLTSNNTYRWGGTTYVEISQSTIHKFVKTITAQSNGNVAVSHNLGTEDVIVSVYDMSGNQVIVGVNIMNSSNITLEFANVKNGTEDFKVVIIA